MRTCSSFPTKCFVIFFLYLTSACFGKRDSFDSQDLTSLLGDLRSLESEEQKSILKSLSMSEDILIGEESKKSILIRIDPEKNRHPPDQRKQHNDTNGSYDVVQWYRTPSKMVEHHVEGRELDSSIDHFRKVINSKDDLKAQGTSPYGEQHNHDSQEHNHDNHYHADHHHDDHYHIDHHHQDSPGTDDAHNQFGSYRTTEDSNNHDGPSSDVFYKKLKLKKVRRNCTRSKGKKAQGWPDRSDSIVHSRSNNVPEVSHYESKPFESVPALPEARFHDGPKLPEFPDTYGKIGFSGEHLHGIPRTHFFQYKDGEGINHYHLHNHNHIYTADGKKISLKNGPTYRNLVNHFEKLKTMLTLPDSGNRYSIPHLPDNYESSINNGNYDSKPDLGSSDSPKMGYHYTGTHESYGRKTYKRVYPNTKINSGSGISDDKSFGMEMFRYGAGQYGTDEFSSVEDKGRYPNEVSEGVDKTYPSSGETYEPVRNKPNYNSPSSLEYNSDSPRSEYPSHSGEYDSSYNNGEKDAKYNTNYEDKAPYTPAPPTRGGTTSDDFNSEYGKPSSDGQKYTDPYPAPFNHDNDDEKRLNELDEPPSIPPLEPSGNPTPQNLDVTHSVSYSQDGRVIPDVGNPGPSIGNFGPNIGDFVPNIRDLGPGLGSPINYGNENPHLFIRPEPDPLTIPKNARVFEHHIRLHPMHYNVFAGPGGIPLNIIGNAPVNPMLRSPVNYPPTFGNTAYPVPLHKLMPNPLKVPIVPPAAPMYRNPFLNQMLQTYQGRSLHHRWW